MLKLVIWDVTGNSDYSAITSTFYQGKDPYFNTMAIAIVLIELLDIPYFLK